MSAFSNALTGAAGVSAVSLVGIAAMPFTEAGIKRIAFILVSLATGALFGDAILHVLPEVFRHDASAASCYWVLGGIIASFVFEKILRWKDHHELDQSQG